MTLCMSCLKDNDALWTAHTLLLDDTSHLGVFEEQAGADEALPVLKNWTYMYIHFVEVNDQ